MAKNDRKSNFHTTIFSKVGEFKVPTILTPVFMIGEVAMEMVIPLLMASIIDKGVNVGDMGHIVRIGIWMFLAAALGLLFGLGGAFCGARASTGLARNLRKAEFEHIQRFSFKNIDHFGVSGLITRLTTDVVNIQNSFQMMLRIGFRAPTSLIVAMAMALFSALSKSRRAILTEAGMPRPPAALAMMEFALSLSVTGSAAGWMPPARMQSR